MKSIRLSAVLMLSAIPLAAMAQAGKAKPEDTEQWSPAVPVVTPGRSETAAPPSDATILFDGRSLDKWVTAKDGSPARWTVAYHHAKPKTASGRITS